MKSLDFTPKDRQRVWQFLITRLEEFYANPEQVPVSPKLDVQEIKHFVSKYNFGNSVTDEEALQHVIDGLTQFTVHTSHPSYYGLFNPRANFPGILADVITAVFNPQLAAWSHAPFAAEVENFCINELGKKFGYKPVNIDGTFCTGGAEANLTAVLCALTNKFPDYAVTGIKGLSQQPAVYCSSEAHHSVIRACKVTGLGGEAVRAIPVDNTLGMRSDLLTEAIQADLANNKYPLMVVASAGTTGSGAIDPLESIGDIANKYDLWFHVDAAYGGALIVAPEMKHILAGIEVSDSITIDIHKWISAPMATSILLTSSKDILGRTFKLTANYMPRDSRELPIEDPFAHSIQWSRRFIGLKLYLTLLMFGWDGVAQMIKKTIEMASKLKQLLQENNWTVINSTPLPIVCFTDLRYEDDKMFVDTMCQGMVRSGKAWISVYDVGETPTLRACITNYNTDENDLKQLVENLNVQREEYF